MAPHDSAKFMAQDVFATAEGIVFEIQDPNIHYDKCPFKGWAGKTFECTNGGFYLACVGYSTPEMLAECDPTHHYPFYPF